MISAKVALRPKTEAPRRSARTEQGTTNNAINNEFTDITAALRLQRLRLLGIIGHRAEMLASHAWELVR